MVPAVYMDLGSNGKECNATQSMSMTVEGYVAAHLVLFSILPYLVPLAACAYPAVKLYSTLSAASSSADADDDDRWGQTGTALILFASYALVYTPVALLTTIAFPSLLQCVGSPFSRLIGKMSDTFHFSSAATTLTW